MTLPDLVREFKALGHPARLRIVAMLADGELCACQVTTVLDLAPSTVSGHLAELRRAGIVVERKVGRWVHYRLARSNLLRELERRLGGELETDQQVASDAAVVRQLRAVPVQELCSADMDLKQLSIVRP